MPSTSRKRESGRAIAWRVHLTRPPEVVYRFLATDEGRARFWAESAVESRGVIHFRFPNGMEDRSRILASDPPRRFSLAYFGSRTTFELTPDGSGGTDLALRAEAVPAKDWADVHAGWVSVLLSLKAAVEFAADLRNHDPSRTWDQGYAEN